MPLQRIKKPLPQNGNCLVSRNFGVADLSGRNLYVWKCRPVDQILYSWIPGDDRHEANACLKTPLVIICQSSQSLSLLIRDLS